MTDRGGATNVITPDLVILDRDDTLVYGALPGNYLIRTSDVQLIPGVSQALELLRGAGAKLAVATNQRCISLGLATAADVDAVNRRINDLLEAQGAGIDGFYVCPHAIGQCSCRKPAPGLLLRAMVDFGASPESTVMIGDRDVDLQAADAAGVRGIQVCSPGAMPGPDLLAVARVLVGHTSA